jgi:alpha-1,2-mannosyltransferase
VTRSRILAAAAIVATIVLGAQTWHKALRPGGNDLTSYLLSARALWDGQSPYGLETPFPYIYPLFLAFVLIPLAALPYGAAVVAWFAASVAALGAVFVESAFRRIADGGRRSAELAIAATVLITFNIIQNNLLNGQVNFFVVLCCALAVAAAQDRKEVAAGAWLGAAIALKLMPALLVVYLLVRRQFRAILVAIVTALVLALAPALLIRGSAAGFVESGFSRITAVYSQYLRELLLPMMTTPEGDTVLAYSVASVVQRATGAGPALWFDVLCAAAVLGLIAALDVRIWHRRGDHLTAAVAYLTAIVLISPKSETHHLAFAIPAVALCFSKLLGEGQRAASLPALPARRSLGEGGTLLVSAVAIAAAPFTGAAEGPMITAAMLLLIAALARIPTSCTRLRA